jgi:SsrA-binding protein
VRKLLLKKEQITKLVKATREKGTTMVPLSLYFQDGKAKVEIAVAVGKNTHDKRAAIAERDSKREVSREIGRRNKGDI